MVRHARERGGAASAALALGVLALIVAGLHDYAFQTGLLAITASFWLPYVMPLALGCLAVLLVGRMVRAVGEVEALNIELDRRVAARTRELEAANGAQTRFLAAASHDLRQPVVTIGLLVGLVREQLSALPPVRAMVDRIYAAVGSMEALLNGLMDLSRLEPGTLKPRLQPVPLAWIFDAISLHEQTAAALKGLRLTFRPTALVVTSDPVLLDQIVRNLVSNAVRYTERGGVLVGARRRGAGTVIVQVWDSGVGIAADAQARVFDEFVQLANPGRDRSKGQGLGLAIVRRGAQALGHRLELRSVAGRGSCFTIELPLAAQALAPEVVAASPPDPLHARVLWLIEDDAALRDALSLRLTRWGAQVTALASVADVRRQLDTCAAAPALLPALILSDQRLPDGSGLECIALIRAAAGHPVPAVVVSGDTAPADLARLAAAGLPVLRKPFRAAELLALLHAALPEDSATLDRCRRGRRHQPQPEARGGDDSLGARIRIELAEDRREMGLDGRFGHIERARSACSACLRSAFAAPRPGAGKSPGRPDRATRTAPPARPAAAPAAAAAGRRRPPSRPAARPACAPIPASSGYSPPHPPGSRPGWFRSNHRPTSPPRSRRWSRATAAAGPARDRRAGSGRAAPAARPDAGPATAAPAPGRRPAAA